MKKIPYEIILKSDGLNSFKRKSEMHIFSLFDFLVVLSPDGNKIIGRV